jgi:hypothetical protein
MLLAPRSPSLASTPNSRPSITTGRSSARSSRRPRAGHSNWRLLQRELCGSAQPSEALVASRKLQAVETQGTKRYHPTSDVRNLTQPGARGHKSSWPNWRISNAGLPSGAYWPTAWSRWSTSNGMARPQSNLPTKILPGSPVWFSSTATGNPILKSWKGAVHGASMAMGSSFAWFPRRNGFTLPISLIHCSRSTLRIVDPLLHQIVAVYGDMLPRQPLRFLLADDPGAGKTIMAGLLIMELLIRGDLHRCLIVCPGNLVEQWQDELYQRFQLPFEILTNDKLEAARTGNWFAENPLAIRSPGQAQQERRCTEQAGQHRLGPGCLRRGP